MAGGTGNIWAAVGALGAILGAVAAVIGAVSSFDKPQQAPPMQQQSSTASPAIHQQEQKVALSETRPEAPFAPAEQPVDGVWTVVITCQDNASVREQSMRFSGGRLHRQFDGGETRLSMYLVGDREIRANGNVYFAATGEIYPINARGEGRAGSYSGSATFGTATDCPFNATREDE